MLCVSCSTVLCQPTGGKARLTEGQYTLIKYINRSYMYSVLGQTLTGISSVNSLSLHTHEHVHVQQAFLKKIHVYACVHVLVINPHRACTPSYM